jgi:transposase
MITEVVVRQQLWAGIDAGKSDQHCVVIDTDGDMACFDSVDRLAGVSGLAPVPHDSGRISGNLKRPRRYDRRLLRACYLSAQIAIRTDAASRVYYDRKRSEGKTHTQAVLALARRRLNVLWAMLRDHAAYHPATTTAAA